MLGGNFESSIIVWDIIILKPIISMIGHQSSITCIVSLEDSVHLASGSYDNNILVWNYKVIFNFL